MFDLITGNIERPFGKRAPGSTVLSAAAHVLVATVIIGIPLLNYTSTLPNVPDMMAFVSAPLAPPPPSPPPPPPEGQPKQAVHGRTQPASASAAPIEAPHEITPEPATARAANEGVEGGVEGGAPGGVVGGAVGGLATIEAPPPPPPPPTSAAPRAPVRVGGQINTPALVHRVEPIYPDVAAAAQITGIVILEAVVDTTGCVESVKVLRGHPLLNRVATEALTQWRYTPLVLNGIPTAFVLTVTFNFSVSR
jgi:protein TonB